MVKKRKRPARLRARDEAAPEEQRAGGRPPIYDYRSHPKRAFRLTLLGATLDDLGVAFGVSSGAIDKWMREHSDFADEVRRARLEADAKVVHSLYRRAVGYSHREDKIFSHPETQFTRARVVKVRTRKHYAPDTAAAIRWLAVRQPEKGWAQGETRGGDKGGGAPIGVRDESKLEVMASILNLIKPKPDGKSTSK